MRPLDFLGSLKLKLGVVIVAAVVVTAVVVWAGEKADLPTALTGFVAAVLALGLVQLLAHGMTFPLRQMVAAARAMARGDYSRRVTDTSRDEVGELARAFNAMAAELEEVDRMRRDLVANASHELRTPIGALQARLENLVDGVEAPDKGVLEEMLGQVERLGSLVEQLLDLSKLESGAVPLERAVMPARDLLQHVVSDWSGQAASRGVRLVANIDPPGLEVAVDPERMRQVLGNLVANAIRHSPPDGRVRLCSSAVNGVTRIEVEDEGPGIPASESERVFERFYRSDPARSSNDGGAGLGLAITRWIVELHGGEIRVDPSMSRGCKMVVQIPR